LIHRRGRGDRTYSRPVEMENRNCEEIQPFLGRRRWKGICEKKMFLFEAIVEEVKERNCPFLRAQIECHLRKVVEDSSTA
jgi:hypothetical protein